MAAILGLNAKAFENIDYTAPAAGAAHDDARAAAYSDPDFTERSNIRDVTLNLERATADITTRAGNGYRQVASTLAEASVDFQLVYDPDDAFFTALKKQYEAQLLIDMAFADGEIGDEGTAATGGTDGVIFFRAEFAITNFSITQNLEEAMMVDCTLQSGFSANAPGFTTVG